MARGNGRRLVELTSHDYHMTMKEKPVRVAALKARLSEYLRAVRRGHPVTVYDRDTPVARLVPYESGAEPLMVRQPLHSLRDVALPPPIGRKVDSLAALLEERQPVR
jgi:prevent-host-death family protein